MNLLILVLFVCSFALFGSFAPASAYIDPAATSYVLQLIVGAVVVGGAAIGYYVRKIRRKVNKSDEKNTGVSVDDQLSGLEDGSKEN